MKTLLLCLIISLTFLSCEKYQEDTYFIYGKAHWDCGVPFANHEISIYQDFTIPNGGGLTMKTNEEGFFVYRYHTCLEMPFKIHYVGPKYGVINTGGDIYRNIPPKKTINLGDIYVKKTSTIALKVKFSKTVEADSIFVSTGEPRTIKFSPPFSDTLIGPYDCTLFYNGNHNFPGKMTSYLKVSKYVNGLREDQQLDKWVTNCAQTPQEIVAIVD